MNKGQLITYKQRLTVQTTPTTSLIPFKFFGIATMFLAITMGLGTIIYILGSQTELIQKGIQIARSSMQVGSRDEKKAEKVTA